MSKTLSRLNRECGISLKMLQLKRASSRIDGRISWFFSSCGRKLGVPLELRQRCQVPDHVSSGKSSLHASCERPLRMLSSWCRVLGPYLELRLNLRVPLQGRHGIRGRSRASTGESGLVSCGAMQVCSPLEPKKQCQASYHVDHRDGCLSLEVPQGCHSCHRVLSQS